jgi:hypothetical protein
MSGVDMLERIKGLLMKSPLGSKELDEYIEAVKKAAYEEGYRRARLDMALGQDISTDPAPERVKRDIDQPRLPLPNERLEALREDARKAGEEQSYTTRTTVAMTKTIALDYLKRSAPRIVGPSEIKKNSEKDLKIFISFGTLKRAMDQLVATGEAEQVEPSRWRYKSQSGFGGAMLRVK